MDTVPKKRSSPACLPFQASVAIAMSFTILAAAAWRKWGEPIVFKVLRWAEVSASDRHETAWHTQIANGNLEYTQRIVQRKDRVAEMCYSLNAFDREPTGGLMPDGAESYAKENLPLVPSAAKVRKDEGFSTRAIAHVIGWD